MHTHDNDSAPMTQTERWAAIGLPAFLVMGVLQIWEIIAWSDGKPLAVKLAFLACVAAIFWGMFWSRRNTDCQDERERMITFKATRNGFVFLAVGIMMLSLGTGPATAWDVADGAVAALFLALAVQCASILLYARRGV